MVRLATYALGSAVGAVAVIYNAFKSRGQFYPAMMYLSTSKINVVILVNMALVMICALWQLVKTLFLGSLREAEVERLNEQSWREVMEILFVITIFRDEFSVTFLAMVTILLLIKAFHWLAQKRIEYMETTPSVSRFSHLRIIGFMIFLLILDSLFFYSNFSYLLANRRPSVELFFSFEYIILASTTVATFLKYAFYLSDMLMEGQWESKALFTFYLELIRDLLHLSLYLCFFLVIFLNKGLPLHLVRELYDTFRNFKSRVADFIRYRKITSNMNDRFPDATAEELRESDATCIICREEMVAAKKLRCGHLFHVHCLRSWLERQQTCPTCRSPVIAPEPASAAERSAQFHRTSQAEGMQTDTQSNDGSSSPAGQNPEPNNPLSQHEARVRAAASAAAQYGSSFVCASGQPSTLSWRPGYVFVPRQSVGEVHNSDGTLASEPRTAHSGSQVHMGVQDWSQFQTVMPQYNCGISGSNLSNSQSALHLPGDIMSHPIGNSVVGYSSPHNNLPVSLGSLSVSQGTTDLSALLNIQQMLLKQRIESLQQELQSISQLQQSLISASQAAFAGQNLSVRERDEGHNINLDSMTSPKESLSSLANDANDVRNRKKGKELSNSSSEIEEIHSED
eukprot:TRINITY_DN17364_c0_g1_i1.p1 TRINITY_DN17364_c0_g1~~TRINITY_DN17364_c0_g1_i1.p1  ORF type:complete len:625 (+),score=90.56 TRINITY_DN17364_c0_g1_i1:195-2069(+)